MSPGEILEERRLELEARNGEAIDREIAWFQAVLDLRLKVHAGEPREHLPIDAFPPPELPEAAVPYAEIVRRFELDAAERLLLILAFLPHIRPGALDPFFLQNRALGRRFTEFGGVTGTSHGGILPTAETAMFLLAGEEAASRLRFHDLFRPDHVLYRHSVLQLEERQREEPPLSAALRVTPEFLERLSTGRAYHPPSSPEFPAEYISTPHDWEDLVLDSEVRSEIEDIVIWARNQERLLGEWGLEKRIKPGFRSLFYGPPGTGKTLTACLLGKATSAPVFRVDLSKVVSKYIGETEKNLASLFDHAQHRRWILFFDEADSLFGKRTDSRTANDRANNQQVAYLLQRIEAFPGVVILATNLQSHIDPAFARRFQSIVHFQMPDYGLRLRLWRDNFEQQPYQLAADVDLPALAREHELSGGSIVNVLRYACLRAVSRDPHAIQQRDLVHGIRRELHKEGRFLGAPR